MNRISMYYIAISAVLGAAAVAGGAAWMAKLAGQPAGMQYLFIGAAWLVPGLVGMMFLRARSQRRAVAPYLFWSLAINVALMPMMLAITLPMIWMHGFFRRPGHHFWDFLRPFCCIS